MVRSGLVGGMRGKVWMEASGAAAKLESSPMLYSQLLEDNASPESLACEAIGQIEVLSPLN
jgi:hypothetical protein